MLGVIECDAKFIIQMLLLLTIHEASSFDKFDTSARLPVAYGVVVVYSRTSIRVCVVACCTLSVALLVHSLYVSSWHSTASDAGFPSVCEDCDSSLSIHCSLCWQAISGSCKETCGPSWPQRIAIYLLNVVRSSEEPPSPLSMFFLLIVYPRALATAFLSLHFSSFTMRPSLLCTSPHKFPLYRSKPCPFHLVNASSL
jgi:hypothetical protein